MTGFEDAFAPELWSMICSKLSTKDVARLARVSSSIQRLVRPILYRVVTIPDNFYSATLTLLASNRDLPRNITCFEISLSQFGTTDNGKGVLSPTKELFLDLLPLMSSLKALCFSVTNFDDAIEQGIFVDRLNAWSANHSLQRFEFTHRESCRVHKPFPSAQFYLARLTRIEWFNDRGNYYVEASDLNEYYTETITAKDNPYVWGAMQASQDTLEEIALRGLNQSKLTDDLPLWRMRFPHLRTLYMGDVDVDHPNCEAWFRPFLVTHSSIEKLSFDNYSCGRYPISSRPKDPMVPNTLPNLKVFRGNITVFLSLAIMKLNSLKNMTRLELLPDSYAFPEEIMHVFERLLRDDMSSPPLPSLKELKVNLRWWDQMDRSTFMELMEGWAKVCGESLEVWLGDQHPCPMSSDISGEIYKKFKKLRVLHICECTAWPDEEGKSEYEDEGGHGREKIRGEDLESYLITIANRCLTLEKVYVKTHMKLSPMIYEIDVEREGYSNGKIRLNSSQPLPPRLRRRPSVEYGDWEDGYSSN